MTAADPIPDRAELLARARKRLRRVWLVIAWVVGTAALAYLAALVIMTRDDFDGSAAALIVAGLVLVAGGGGLILLILRRRADHPDLASGLDRPTRKAVTAALRAGRTDDRRIDALIRENATRSINKPWTVAVIALAAVLNAVLLVSRLVERDRSGVALRAVLLVGFTWLAVQRGLEIRRTRAYLRRSAAYSVQCV